jgi:hypothetical protein
VVENLSEDIDDDDQDDLMDDVGNEDLELVGVASDKKSSVKQKLARLSQLN